MLACSIQMESITLDPSNHHSLADLEVLSRTASDWPVVSIWTVPPEWQFMVAFAVVVFVYLLFMAS